MRIATWNVNSIGARLPRLLDWLATREPDAVALQETKASDDAFPYAELADLGYQALHVGDGRWNGVAVLSRVGLTPVATELPGHPEPRYVSARCGPLTITSVYVPNGRALGDPHYAYKLDWLARLRALLERESDPARPLALVGDFNVAPADADVHDPVAWRGQVLCSEPERAALRHVVEWGLVDAFRSRYPDKIAYTWWDYRMLGFPKNHGLRIDHVLLTRPLVDKLEDVVIDRDERKGKGASDHAPVLAVLR